VGIEPIRLIQPRDFLTDKKTPKEVGRNRKEDEREGGPGNRLPRFCFFPEVVGRGYFTIYFTFLGGVGDTIFSPARLADSPAKEYQFGRCFPDLPSLGGPVKVMTGLVREAPDNPDRKGINPKYERTVQRLVELGVQEREGKAAGGKPPARGAPPPQLFPPEIGLRHRHLEVLPFVPFCHLKQYNNQTVCQRRNAGK